MRWTTLVGLSAFLAFGACATQPVLPDHPGVVTAIQRYYVSHAIEQNGRCVLPEMTVMEATVVEQTGDRLVVDAGYHWEDRRRSDDVATTCLGFSNRTFTLFGGQVLGMSGEHR